ncbi:MAG TPA: PIN domain-containing protein [Streptosporangiaceae bacterium]|nr:PIN domain-containing protein [Streptosporangiaceae bacterium]
MSEETGAVPPPYVLDVSVLTELVRGGYGVMALVQQLGASGRPLVLPVLAMTAASLDLRSEDASAILYGLEKLANATAAPVKDAEQAVELAAVIAKTGLDPYDAHVAAIADASVCPILTLDAAKWRPHLHDLDEALHIVEIEDPGEGTP